MLQIAQSYFDQLALALPAGLAFGDSPPIEAWQTQDGVSCGVITRNDEKLTFGILVMRRREDDVWTVTQRQMGLASHSDAKEKLALYMVEDAPREAVPAGIPRRAPLWKVQGDAASNIFRSLLRPTHHIAAWMLNQLYLALPSPDANWASDCQTGNFHTRLWEAHLLACFREQGLRVSQPHPSPDFHIRNRAGGEAWIEAVTANPPVPYDHFNAAPPAVPATREQRLIGPAAVRFAKTLRSKLAKQYDQLAHVKGKPFAIALADFQSSGSMTWSREALPCYLYGRIASIVEHEGVKRASGHEVSALLGEDSIPAGLFGSEANAGLSAVLFSNACSIAKLNRVPISAGADVKEYRYLRVGTFFDRTPGALTPIPFCLDITSDEYRALWPPYHYEPWSAELEVFHNPNARYPLADALLPEATHWHEIGGEIACTSFYETSILSSHTLIRPRDTPVPTVEELLRAADSEE